MSSREESYFIREAKSILARDELILTFGYFRSAVARYGAASIISAVKANGYFLAQTESNLLVIETRAPAFRKPLMENNRSYVIPISKINKIITTPEYCQVEYFDGDVLVIQPFTSTKYLSKQSDFINWLIKSGGQECSLEEVEKFGSREHNRDKFALWFIFAICSFILLSILLIPV
ncbi:hypothetical protein FLL45_09895 [Aliikangiella marina]|uniref:Uncharacterized protein n=1 Tax=Aliikangiella marina TaxID=1712262 RepID=A0A545TDD9_9GAMM|nr:hypothetical protein [Aliikangiella marina]TQV75238.1 hypothetical protein FLL45_09895 [Aliikangiella marina]